ncbi:hypothetical protein SAMN05192583_0603 [Sphingomonas gellani]|uniref:Uncharacterized protein n=1 Tax=Sphingomonas gellani TaxID=1166340 RepID=A0A1H7ZA79_9SPHN|nr:hypothetical protein [Sphingomonas gellani]SEM55320.1 hypothetical protein SAMN05192583_0603 [Sphingomonas gellani]
MTNDNERASELAMSQASDDPRWPKRTPTPSDEVPVPVERVSLGNCPPGPFIFNGTLGFKTEYGPTDAYCMGTGEAFWGGTTDKIARAALLVQPVEVAALSPATDKGEVAPDEDWLADVLDDSLDMDWTGRVGARAIIAAWGTRHGA